MVALKNQKLGIAHERGDFVRAMQRRGCVVFAPQQQCFRRKRGKNGAEVLIHDIFKCCIHRLAQALRVLRAQLARTKPQEAQTFCKRDFERDRQGLWEHDSSASEQDEVARRKQASDFAPKAMPDDDALLV